VDKRNYSFPFDAFQNFMIAMDRALPTWLMPSLSAEAINLGAGIKDINGTTPFDAPDWMAGTPLPYDDGAVELVLAYHFFEHLHKNELIETLRELERVLQPGGTIVSVVPHWSAEIAHQDLDHKLFFTEQTWDNLFNNKYYDGTMPRDWKFYVGFQMIMGLVQRNLVLMTQIVRTDD
jgi:SAM-dependent methyltransferase